VIDRYTLQESLDAYRELYGRILRDRPGPAAADRGEVAR